jgi:hypothetical protein
LSELRTLVDALEVGAQYGRLGVPGRVIDALASLKRRIRRPGAAATLDAPVANPGDVGVWLDERLLRQTSTSVTRWIVRHSEVRRLIERRRANYAYWSRSMMGIAGVEPLFPTLAEGAVPYVFPLWVRDAEAAYPLLRAAGVPIFRWDIAWPGVPELPGDQGKKWLSAVFQLGCHQDLEEEDMLRLAPLVKRLLQR